MLVTINIVKSINISLIVCIDYKFSEPYALAPTAEQLIFFYNTVVTSDGLVASIGQYKGKLF